MTLGSSTVPLGSRNDERAQPFVSGKGALGVVLLHGLTGTPHDVRQFAEAFAGRGFVVVAPRLAGHEDPTKLEASSWHDWYDSAQDALDECRSRGAERVAVIGFSMGGLVALRLGALRNHQVTALATLAAPLTVRPTAGEPRRVAPAPASPDPNEHGPPRLRRDGPQAS